jgi:hypothetical protein
MLTFIRNDGGRAAAGFKGSAGDCVARAIAIASGKPYAEVYARLAAGNETQRQSKHSRRKKASAGKRTAAHGIWTRRKWFKEYMAELGFEWNACMSIGSGCTTHLREDELPAGRIIVSLSRHWAAVIDGVLHDTYDCSRDGERCVYGYWRLAT